MSILDDARRLAAATITRDGTVWCHFCGSMIEDPQAYDPPLPLAEQHSDDCPWLVMPKIVAALEVMRTTETCSARVIEMAAMRGQGKTLQEIGKHFGVSRERVRSLLERARARLAALCSEVVPPTPC